MLYISNKESRNTGHVLDQICNRSGKD